ncbi:MAG: hypothetical protein U0359_24070 [Byssovorax sp.]
MPPRHLEEKDFDVSSTSLLGARLTGLGTREMHEVLRLLFIPARDYFEEVLADEKTRAVCAAIAVRALSTGPFAAGTMFSFLHQHAVDDGFSRCTAPGGLWTPVAAMSRRRAPPGSIRTSAPGRSAWPWRTAWPTACSSATASASLRNG